MASTFSKFVVLHVIDLRYTSLVHADAVGNDPGFVILQNVDSPLGVLNPRAKIEVEAASIDTKYVHFRFTHTNKYWGRSNDGLLVAESDQPEEDMSKPSCTLFEPIRVNDGRGFQYLTHVQTGFRLAGAAPNRLMMRSVTTTIEFGYTDWDSIVKLPGHVAFKGDNGKYLQASLDHNNPYQHFTADDRNAVKSGYRITPLNDGNVRISSDYHGMVLNRHNNWIMASSLDSDTGNKNSIFTPIKIDDGTIALKNVGNNQFCKRLSNASIFDALSADVGTITAETRLVVEELVSNRRIYNVSYMMNFARIYDTQPFLAGSSRVDNPSSQPSTNGVQITYQDERSYSFNRSVSITAGVSSTIEAGVLGIVNASITVSFEINTTLEWSNTTTTTTSVTASTTVDVPPRSSVVVNYVGTRAKCDVPFSYSQRDTSSTNGDVVQTQQVDGIFSGVNSYNFHFEIEDAKALED